MKLPMAIASILGVLPLTAGADAAPHVDHRVGAFLEALNSAGGPPLETLSPEAARQVLVDAQASVDVDLSGVEVSQRSIEADGRRINLHIVRPEGVDGTLPAFMFFHGGGWVLGDFPTHRRLVRDLVVRSGAVAVFVDYTPSPEAHYPVAINQAYAATQWVADHGDEIGVDGSRLAVAGNSVGGNMAAVVSLMAEEKGTPALKSQVLMWPVTDADFDTGSYRQFPNGYFLSQGMMRWFWDNYTTDETARNSIYASPLRASDDQLSGLPPALIQVAELDVLRDEGEAYGRRLDEAGVDVTVTRYNGTIHDFGLLNVLADVPSTQTALDQAGLTLRQTLAE